MRQLLPEPVDHVEPEDAYAVPSGTSRHVRVNMVSSADGAAAVGGRVGSLSGRADQSLLHLLRALADVVLVGAGTVRAEGYGPARMSEDRRRRREEAGQLSAPPLAIVTRSLDLDLSASLFTAGTVRPVVVTAASASEDRLRAVREVADVIVAGDDRVDMGEAISALVDRGLTRILSEGGPHLLAELFAGDLVDELCLAVAPLITCGHQLRITAGPPLAPPAALRLAHVLEEDEFLFLRYTRPLGTPGRIARPS